METAGEHGRKRRRPVGSQKKRRKAFWEDNASWRDATPADPMALLVGSEEGGFYSLEEIDGELFDGAGALDPVTESPGQLKVVDNTVLKCAPEVVDLAHRKRKHDRVQTPTAEVVDLAQRKRTRKKDRLLKCASEVVDNGKQKKSQHERILLPTPDVVDLGQRKSKHDEVLTTPQIVRLGHRKSKREKVLRPTAEVVDFDLSAWVHLRLHPLLEKAVASLRFKEPTPIQNECIPAAAHQGKDVIGAAETGSGKTLAFGIPILQRLLEEHEKSRRQSGDEPADEEIANSRSGPLRALIVTPTRELALQVSDHLKAVAKFTTVRVVPIVGGMATQKQERLLKLRPEIVVGTPGRLWELMSEGERHLLDLQALSFFVLDEADRMVERGHFKELQSIIDMLPRVDEYGRPQRSDEEVDDGAVGDAVEEGEPDGMVIKRGVSKRRQTLVFSATLALPDNFRKKLKRGIHARGNVDSSLGALSERAGVRSTAAIVDLTSKSIVAQQLVESVVECRDDEKDAYLYYILKVHGCGQAIVFCTSIAAVRRVSSILRLLQLPVWPLHAQMQQRQRLKAMDRFRGTGYSILVATDVAARGLDIPGVRTVIHYQLPHSAEVYVHRSGRTARAQSDGCSITFVTPTDRSKYAALCGSLSRKDGLSAFPVDSTYMPAVERRVALATQVDKISRNVSQGQEKKSWLALNSEALGLDVEDTDEHGGDTDSYQDKARTELRRLQQQLGKLLIQPLEPKSFSRRYIAGAGISPLVAQQLREVVGFATGSEVGKKASGSFVVIGQEAVEPLEAVRKSMLESQKKPQRSLENRKSRGKGRRR